MRYLKGGAGIRLLYCCSLFLCLSQAVWCANQVQILPQFVSGGGWTSTLYLINQGAGTTSANLLFFDDDGQPLTVATNMGTDSSLNISLSAGGSQVVGSMNQGNLSVGYAVVVYPDSSRISCSELFINAQAGTVITELGVQAQAAGQAFSFPAMVDSATKVNTGLAIANYNDEAQTAVVNLINSDGTLFGHWLVTLSAYGHCALYLDELVSGLEAFGGAVTVSAPEPVGVLALRQDQGLVSSIAVTSGPITGAFLLVTPPLLQESEPNNTIAQAQQIMSTTVISGTIDPAGDVDYYTFTGSKGDLVTALVDVTAASSSFVSALTLQTADGTILAASTGTTDNCDSFLQFILPADGAYYLSVTDSRGQGGDGYAYRLNLVLPASSPTIAAIIPSALALRSVYPLTLTIQGSHLDGATGINILPAGTIIVSGLQSNPTQATAQVTLAPNPQLGIYGVWVVTKDGISNGLSLTLSDPDIFQFDGEWEGTTAEGEAVTISVTNGGIANISFAWTLGACTGGTGMTITPPSPILGNTFDISGGGTSDTIGPFEFAGSFDGTTASGTLEETGYGDCAGHVLTTWSALKF